MACGACPPEIALRQAFETPTGALGRRVSMVAVAREAFPPEMVLRHAFDSRLPARQMRIDDSYELRDISIGNRPAPRFHDSRLRPSVFPSPRPNRRTASADASATLGTAILPFSRADSDAAPTIQDDVPRSRLGISAGNHLAPRSGHTWTWLHCA